MAKKLNPKEKYERLRDRWYAKLKKSGFEDIEQDEDNLKIWSSTYFGHRLRTNHAGGWQAKAAYYSMAERFLHEYQFSSNLEHAIWEYHTNGISIRDITDTLKKAKVKTNRQYVWEAVHKLEIEMKKLYLEGYKSK